MVTDVPETDKRTNEEVDPRAKLWVEETCLQVKGRRPSKRDGEKVTPNPCSRLLNDPGSVFGEVLAEVFTTPRVCYRPPSPG